MNPRVLVVSLMMLLFSVALFATATFVETDPGDPLIIFIHGRDQAGEDPAKLMATWYKAFDDGQVAIGLPNLISEQNRRFVWYGDIYGKNPPPLPAACKFAAGFVPNERLRRVLIRLARTAGLSKEISKNFLNDTYHYLSDISFRCATNERLATALRSTRENRRPVVIVAHSMGAIVSLDMLWNSQRSDQHFDIAHLVTLGTQVGVPEVLAATQGSMVEPPVPVPQDIRAWTNIKNRGDKLAFTAKGRFKATDRDREPEEVMINTKNPSRHSIVGYLSDAVVNRKITAAWCNAFSPSSSAPTSCKNFIRIASEK